MVNQIMSASLPGLEFKCFPGKKTIPTASHGAGRPFMTYSRASGTKSTSIISTCFSISQAASCHPSMTHTLSPSAPSPRLSFPPETVFPRSPGTYLLTPQIPALVSPSVVAPSKDPFHDPSIYILPGITIIMTIVTCLVINCLYFLIEIKFHEVCLLFFLILYANCLFVVVVQSPSHIQLFVTPWTAAHQASVLHFFPEFAQTHAD